MVLYWANLSPHKNRTALVDTEWESVSLLCSSKDGEDEKKEREREGACVNNRFCFFLQQKRNRCRISKIEGGKSYIKSGCVPACQTSKDK